MTIFGSPQRSGRSPISSLVLISVLFLGSAALRMATQAGPAIAREVAGEAEPELAQPQERAAPDKAELQRLLDLFRKRESALALRERELNDRKKALELSEVALDQKMAALKQAEESLRATLSQADGAAKQDIARLINVYENMKPKNSAKLFEEMDPEFAAGFLARMRPDAAAGIMAGLDPTTAYSISVVLAGRNAGVPKN